MKMRSFHRNPLAGALRTFSFYLLTVAASALLIISCSSEEEQPKQIVDQPSDQVIPDQTEEEQPKQIVDQPSDQVIPDQTEKVPEYIKRVKAGDAAPWKYTGSRLPREQVFIEHNWKALRTLMWNYVGVVRSDRRLEEAHKRIRIIEGEIEYHYWKYLITPGLVEMRNLVQVAKIIIESAMSRKESRGLNCNIDHMSRTSKYARNTYISL